MKNLIKDIYIKIVNNLIKFDLLLLFIFLITQFILYIFNLKFRLWFILLIYLIIIILFIYGFIKILLNKFSSKKNLIIKISVIICVPMLILLGFIIRDLWIERVHIVTFDEKKYVAQLVSSSHTDVYYYNYYGPILMGTNVRIIGDYGQEKIDPFDKRSNSVFVEYSFYNKKGKREKIRKKVYSHGADEFYEKYDDFEYTYDKNSYYILPEEEEVLYEKKFDDYIIRIGKLDNVLGQNMGVNVIKSIDGGETFRVISKENIIVSNEAKFTMLNKDLVFMISTGQINLKSGVGLIVSKDGGLSFSNAKFNYKKEGVEYMDIDSYPYYEEDTLRIECSVYALKDNGMGYETIKLIFESKNNGLTWNLVD